MKGNLITLALFGLLLSTAAVWYFGSLSDTGLIERTNSQAEAMARHERIKIFASAWDQNPQYPAAYDALDPNLNVTAGSNAAFDPTDDYWGLPRSAGYELVDGYCTGCHSIRIVMQQRADRDRWDALLTWMVEKQGMPDLIPAERTAILSYLSQEFGN